MHSDCSAIFAIKLNDNLQLRKNGEANRQSFLSTASKGWEANSSLLRTDKKQLITTTSAVSFSICFIKPTYEPTPTCNIDVGWIEKDSDQKLSKSHSKETTWPKRLQYSTQSFSLDEEKEDQDGGRQLKQNTRSASKYWASTDLIFDPGGYAASSLSHSKLAIQLVSAAWVGCSIWQQSCFGVTILVCNDIKKVIFQRFF